MLSLKTSVNTLVVGDTHLQARLMTPVIDNALSHTRARRLVMVGDYCDPFNVGGESFHVSDEWFISDLMHLVAWVAKLKGDGLVVDLLYGNHDFSYIASDEDSGKRGMVRRILLNELKPQVAVVIDSWLVTHAGVTGDWANNNLNLPEDHSVNDVCSKLNTMAQEGFFKELLACGKLRGGCDSPGPLCADECELDNDSLIGIKQIVGHTPTESCHRGNHCRQKGIDQSTEFWNCNTFWNCNRFGYGDGSMLLVGDDLVTPLYFDDFAPGLSWRHIVLGSKIESNSGHCSPCSSQQRSQG